MLSFYISLIEDHKNDDDFERIYNKYKLMMYKVAKHHTRNHHFAEEAVQLAFIRIAIRIDIIKQFDEHYLEIYLCKAAKNGAFFVLRRELKFASKAQFLDVVDYTDYSSDIVGETALQNELLKMVADYIATLEPKSRDIVTYYFIHNLTLREIAAIMKMPLSTVKTKLYKSKRMIDEKFKEYRND